MAQGIRFIGAAAVQYSEVVIEVREPGEFLIPYAEDREWGDDERSLDVAIQGQTSGDGDGGEALACA